MDGSQRAGGAGVCPCQISNSGCETERTGGTCAGSYRLNASARTVTNLPMMAISCRRRWVSPASLYANNLGSVHSVWVIFKGCGPPRQPGHYWLVDTYGTRIVGHLATDGVWRGVNAGGETYVLHDAYVAWSEILPDPWQPRAKKEPFLPLYPKRDCDVSR